MEGGSPPHSPPTTSTNVTKIETKVRTNTPKSFEEQVPLAFWSYLYGNATHFTVLVPIS